jgi:hypothetical protein
MKISRDAPGMMDVQLLTTRQHLLLKPDSSYKIAPWPTRRISVLSREHCGDHRSSPQEPGAEAADQSLAFII